MQLGKPGLPARTAVSPCNAVLEAGCYVCDCCFVELPALSHECG